MAINKLHNYNVASIGGKTAPQVTTNKLHDYNVASIGDQTAPQVTTNKLPDYSSNARIIPNETTKVSPTVDTSLAGPRRSLVPDDYGVPATTISQAEPGTELPETSIKDRIMQSEKDREKAAEIDRQEENKVGIKQFMKDSPLTPSLYNPDYDPILSQKIKQVLNSPQVAPVIQELSRRASGTGIASMVQAVGPKTFTEAYEANRAAQAGDPSKMNQFLYQLGDTAPQTLIGVALNFVPILGRTLATSYWTALSAAEQIENKGSVTSTSNIAIDVVLDSILGNVIDGLLRVPAKNLAVSLGKTFISEGGTEGAQDVLKMANDYRVAKTTAEKEGIKNDLKEYFTSGQALMTFLVGGISGAGTNAIITAAHNAKSGEVPLNQKGFVQIPLFGKEATEDTTTPETKTINKVDGVYPAESVIGELKEGDKVKVNDKIYTYKKVMDVTGDIQEILDTGSMTENDLTINRSKGKVSIETIFQGDEPLYVFDSNTEAIQKEAKKYNSAEEFIKAQTPEKDYITVYHRTNTPLEDFGKKPIYSKENRGEFFVSNKPNEQIAGYGDNVLELRVKKKDLEINDEFPSGEEHYTIPTTVADEAIKTKSQLTDIWNKANTETTETKTESNLKTELSDEDKAKIKKLDDEYNKKVDEFNAGKISKEEIDKLDIQNELDQADILEPYRLDIKIKESLDKSFDEFTKDYYQILSEEARDRIDKLAGIKDSPKTLRYNAALKDEVLYKNREEYDKAFDIWKINFEKDLKTFWEKNNQTKTKKVKTSEPKDTLEEKAKIKKLYSLNPTSSIFVDYNPQERANLPLADNITTLDKTSNSSPNEIITVYRGAPSTQKEIVAGDFITTNKQLAKDYAGTGNVIEKQVKMSDVLDDITEPLGEEYIYRPQTEAKGLYADTLEDALFMYNSNPERISAKSESIQTNEFEEFFTEEEILKASGQTSTSQPLFAGTETKKEVKPRTEKEILKASEQSTTKPLFAGSQSKVDTTSKEQVLPDGMVIPAKESAKSIFNTKQENEMSDGELQALIASAPKEGDVPLNGVEQEVVKGVTEMVKKDVAISAKEKVGILDYFRTPWKVFDRLGIRPAFESVVKGYENYNQELRENTVRIRNWSKQLNKESQIKVFDYLDGKKVELNAQELKIATEIKTWFSTWADRLGIKPKDRISNYITHIFDPKTGEDIPNEIKNLMKSKPSISVFNPYLLERLNKEGYKKDLFGAVEAYSKRATRKVNMDPVLKEMNEASAKLRHRTSIDYLNKFLAQINLKPSNMDLALDIEIKKIFGDTFGARPTSTITRFTRRMIARAKIGLSMTSFAINLTQTVNTFGELGTRYTAEGYRDLWVFRHSSELEDNGVLLSPLLDDTPHNAIKTTAEKVDDILFLNMTSSELINRGVAYYGAKRKYIDGKITGKEYQEAFGRRPTSENGIDTYKPTMEEAIQYGKFVAAKTQFLFGALHTPVGLNSDLAKTIFQFQTFGIKQTEFVAGMLKNKDWKKFIRYFASSSLVFWIIGKLFGMAWHESIITINRIKSPMFSLVESLWQTLVTKKDSYGNYLNDKKVIEKIADLILTNMIPGGSQIKKATQGISTVKEGKLLSPSGKFQTKVATTPLNYFRGALFGKYNLTESQNFYNKRKAKAKASAKAKGSIKSIFSGSKKYEGHTY